MRIAFTSCSSQGKTTLVDELKKLDKFKDYTTFPSIQRTLAKGVEDFGTSEATTDFTQTCMLSVLTYNLITYPNQINDRSLICMLSYNKISKNVKNYKFIEDKFKDIIKFYDVIFYIPKELEVTKDGFRSIDDDYHILTDNTIKEYIEEYKGKVKIIEVKGTVEERMDIILEALGALEALGEVNEL